MFFDFTSQAKFAQSMTELALSNYTAMAKATTRSMETALDSAPSSKAKAKPKAKKSKSTGKSKSAAKSKTAMPSGEAFIAMALAPYKIYADAFAAFQPAANIMPMDFTDFWKMPSASQSPWAAPYWEFANPYQPQRSAWEQAMDPFEIWTKQQTPAFPFWPVSNQSIHNNAFTYSNSAKQLDGMKNMMLFFAMPPFVQKFSGASPWLNMWG